MPSAENLEAVEQQIIDQYTEAWESHYREQLADGLTVAELRTGAGGQPQREDYGMIAKMFSETTGDDGSEKIKNEILDRLGTEEAA